MTTPAPPDPVSGRTVLATVRSIASLLFSYGLLILGNAMFSTLLSVRSSIEGFSTETTGLVMSGYFMGLLGGGLFAVRVVARVGHIRAYAVFASLISSAALIHVLWIDPLVWFAVRGMSGFCWAGMIMVTESWLNERASNENRGQVLSLYMITNYLGAGMGQFLLPLGDPATFQLFLLASIIFSMAIVPVLLTRATAPQPITAGIVDLRELFRISPLGMIGCLCAGLSNSAIYALGPVFARGTGLSLEQTSLFMACTILSGLLLQWPIGRLSDRIDRRRVLAMAAAATSLAAAGITLYAGRGTHGLFAGAILFGSLAFTLYSLAAAHTNDMAGSGRLVQVAGGLLIMFGVGASTGPILASLLMGRIGPRGLFLFSALVFLALALTARQRMRGREIAPREKQPFTAVPGMQFTSKQLYLRVRDQMDRDLAHMSGSRGSR